MQLQEGHVQGEIGEAEFIPIGSLQHPAFRPGIPQRVITLAAQNPRADLPDILTLARRKIEIPPAVHEMKLRRPDMAAHGAPGMGMPHLVLLRVAKLSKACGTAKHNAVIFGNRGSEVPIVSMVQHIGIGTLGNEGRIPCGAEFIMDVHVQPFLSQIFSFITIFSNRGSRSRSGVISR